MFRHNTPARLQAVYDGYHQLGLFPMFPFGSDFTDIEERLLPALGWLKEKTRPRHLMQLARQTLADDVDDHHFEPHLKRMGLDKPSSLKEKIFKRLIHAALSATGPE
jgi:hypothetical protein